MLGPLPLCIIRLQKSYREDEEISLSIAHNSSYTTSKASTNPWAGQNYLSKKTPETFVMTRKTRATSACLSCMR